MVKQELLAGGDFGTVTRLAREAVEIVRAARGETAARGTVPPGDGAVAR
jgi:hypothetical protein